MVIMVGETNYKPHRIPSVRCRTHYYYDQRMRYKFCTNPFICHCSFRNNPSLNNTLVPPPAVTPPQSSSGLLVFVLLLVMNLFFQTITWPKSISWKYNGKCPLVWESTRLEMQTELQLKLTTNQLFLKL